MQLIQANIAPRQPSSPALRRRREKYRQQKERKRIRNMVFWYVIGGIAAYPLALLILWLIGQR